MVTVAPASAVPDKVVPLEVPIVGAVGAVASTAVIAVEELVLPALSVTVMEPVSPSDSGLVILQSPFPSAVVVASTVVLSAA